MAILFNFILRFTWSLKLSSHLHNVTDMESGVFVMEALEVLRRWVWVFLRVEWEVQRKQDFVTPNGHGLGEDPEEFEFLLRGETSDSGG
jgi:EXS family